MGAFDHVIRALVIDYELRLRRNGIGPRLRVETGDGVARVHRAYLFQGPETWLYVHGQLGVPHAVTFELPEDWEIATGMARTDDPRSFSCPDYDVFADCPIHLGSFERLTFEVEGVEHEIVLSGFEKEKSDRDALVERFRRIVQTSFACKLLHSSTRVNRCGLRHTLCRQQQRRGINEKHHQKRDHAGRRRQRPPLHKRGGQTAHRQGGSHVSHHP